VAGLTPWDEAAPLKGQLRAGGVLHGAAGHGTLGLFLPGEQRRPEAVAEVLREAWERTDVVRLRLLRPGPTQRELTFAAAGPV
jgi:hypothetical protein